VFIARKLIFAVAALMFTVSHPQTSAAQLLYTRTGDTNVSFTVNTQPTPDAVFPDGFLIQNSGRG
jgi:hypothetical protein